MKGTEERSVRSGRWTLILAAFTSLCLLICLFALNRTGNTEAAPPDPSSASSTPGASGGTSVQTSSPGATGSAAVTPVPTQPAGVTAAPSAQTPSAQPTAPSPTAVPATPTATPVPTPTPVPATPTPTPEPQPSPLPSVKPHTGTVRVGLKYGNTAQDVITTGSDSGGTIGVVRNNKTYDPVLAFSRGDVVTLRADSGYHITVAGPFTDTNALRLEMLRIGRLMEGAGTSMLYIFDGASWYIGAGFYQKLPGPGVPDVNSSDKYAVLSGRLAAAGYTLKNLSVGSAAVKVYINGSPVMILSASDSSSKVRLTPCDTPAGSQVPPLMKLGLARYRGYFDVHRHQGGKLVLVNDVEVEDYTLSVVPAEMISGTESSWSWRREGLKAQAILARTLAYYYVHSGKMTTYGFHMDDTTNYQVYAGYTKPSGESGETVNTTRATQETAGRVAIYKGALCQALLYHGNNGGYTDGTETVWGNPQEPYASYPDPWTPDYLWKKTYTGASLSERVTNYIYNQKGISIGSLSYLNVTQRAASGRVTELIFEGTQSDSLATLIQTRQSLSLVGQLFWFDVEEIYKIDYQSDGSSEALSPRARKYLEGTTYSVQFVPDTYAVRGADGYTYERIRILGPSDPKSVIIRGNGHGHGVGVSQDGAEAMSKAGKTCEEIIQFYMPGVTVVDISTVRS